jgi:hypothetical protein
MQPPFSLRASRRANRALGSLGKLKGGSRMSDHQPPGTVGTRTPSWDPAFGRPARRIYASLFPNLFETLDTPFRAYRAAKGTVAAAGVLSGVNALTALLALRWTQGPATVIGHDPVRLAGVQFAAALLAAYLAVRLHRRPSLGGAAFVLAWSLVEAAPWVTHAIYGHGMGASACLLRAGMLFWSIQGLRGAKALADTGGRPRLTG